MCHSLVDWAVLNLFSPLYWEYKMTYSTVTKTETHYMIKQNRFAWRTGSERNSRMKDRGLSPSASKPSVELLWPLRSCAEITKLTFGELICLILFSAGRWTQLFFLFTSSLLFPWSFSLVCLFEFQPLLEWKGASGASVHSPVSCWASSESS